MPKNVGFNVTFNENDFRSRVTNAVLRGTAINLSAIRLMKERVDQEKAILLRKFDESEYTKSIMAGPEGRDVFVKSPVGDGNLYTFIGFRSNPIEEVRSFLEESVKMPDKKINSVKKRGSSLIISFNVNIPTNDDFNTKFKMPDGWAGYSWIIGLDSKGIPNVNYYLFLRGEELKGSRSGPGIQNKRGFRDGGFLILPDPYLPTFVKEFQENLKSI